MGYEKKSPKNILTAYLESHNMRKTHERFAILEEIYSNTGHFDIETLYESMKAKNYTVSLATLYNNIDILLDAGLIIKHQFEKGNTYEKALDCVKHDHFICTECGKIYEISTCSSINDVLEDIKQKYNFNISSHFLTIYGVCEACKEFRKIK